MQIFSFLNSWYCVWLNQVLTRASPHFFFKKSRLVELAACTNLQYHTPALNRLCIAELRFMVLLGLCSSAS